MFTTGPVYLATRLAPLRGPLSLRVELGPDRTDPLAAGLLRLADELVDAAGERLQLELADRGEHPSLTARNVRWIALPSDAELPVLVDLLLALDAAADHASPAALEARLLLLVAPTCPRCAGAAAVCMQLAAQHERVELTVVDAQRFPELAAGCRSVPTLIVDGRRALVGELRADELRSTLAARRGAVLPEELDSLLQAGRLADADRLLGEPGGAAAFAELFGRAALGDRVGLLLLAEEALAARPGCLDAALPYLERVRASNDPARRGDLADLLGRIQSAEARRVLQLLAEDGHPEVREAARAALGAPAAN
jgi:hypothetical protein